MKSKHSYPQTEIDAVYRAIAERRDMRHFINEPLEEGVLAKLLTVANQAPSVGLMQPWRFIRITEQGLKVSIKTWWKQSGISPQICLMIVKMNF